MSRTTARLALLPAAGLLALSVAGPASAHVGISPSDGAAGSYTVLTVSVPHGCDGSPTTRVTIQMPEQVNAVTPTRNALWEVEKVTEQLDEPITDTHGNEITERVSEVVYTTDEPLPEGYRDAFELSLQLPDLPGETLVFPTIQTCEEGETAWTEVAAEGEDGEELESPAPTVTLTEAGGDAHGSADEPVASGDDLAPASATSDEGISGLSVAALVAGLLGLAAGVLALVTARRRA